MSLLQIFSVLLRRNPNLDMSIYWRHTVAYLHAKMMNSSQLETIRQMKYLEWVTEDKVQTIDIFLGTAYIALKNYKTCICNLTL